MLFDWCLQRFVPGAGREVLVPLHCRCLAVAPLRAACPRPWSCAAPPSPRCFCAASPLLLSTFLEAILELELLILARMRMH